MRAPGAALLGADAVVRTRPGSGHGINGDAAGLARDILARAIGMAPRPIFVLEEEQ